MSFPTAINNNYNMSINKCCCLIMTDGTKKRKSGNFACCKGIIINWWWALIKSLPERLADSPIYMGLHGIGSFILLNIEFTYVTGKRLML